ncbi:MAG: formylglycine-generating enzyme family protein [Verrucomicrobiales bacterium]|nr:formylglycine-generating enzyme family protein [Verrucomicrobiales bacterium]
MNHVSEGLSIQLAKGVVMPFQFIPATGPEGFRMGGRGYYQYEEPVHRVVIRHGFHLGTFPVTQQQFTVWTKAAKTKHENEFKGHPDHPAETLDWRQAMEFCRWLNRSGKVPTGWWACLPTEAEWEYACRAGTDTDYHTGDGEAALKEAGWFGEEWGKGSTHSVGQKRPNAFGLHDMHGNVWEWCHDRWREFAYRDCTDGAPDPGDEERRQDWLSGWEALMRDDTSRVLRGGSWYYDAWGCRSALRNWPWPDARYRHFGLRVCLVPGPVPTSKHSSQPVGRAEAGQAGGDGGPRKGPESPPAGPAGAVSSRRSPDSTSRRAKRGRRDFGKTGTPTRKLRGAHEPGQS